MTLDLFPMLKNIDDFYTLIVEIMDKAGNATSSELEFSVNRFGSVYSVNDSTLKIINSYINKESDVVLVETNVDILTEQTISYSKDGSIHNLKKNEDYKIEKVNEDGGWNQYTYTIFAKSFTAEGNYIIMISSSDYAGNLSNNRVKGEEIQFTIDKSEPKATVTGIESKEIYNADVKQANIVVIDNIMLSSVEAILNGQSYAKWEDDEIYMVNGEFIINIPESTKRQTLDLVYIDAAGNKGSLVVDNFLISQDYWVRYYNNKNLMYTSFGVGGSGIGISFLAFFKKKKKKAKE